MSTASPTSLQVNVIIDKANDTAHYSPLGKADQPMMENLPSDETKLFRGDAAQSRVEHLSADLATHEAMQPRVDTDKPMVGRRLPITSLWILVLAFGWISHTLECRNVQADDSHQERILSEMRSHCTASLAYNMPGSEFLDHNQWLSITCQWARGHTQRSSPGRPAHWPRSPTSRLPCQLPHTAALTVFVSTGRPETRL